MTKTAIAPLLAATALITGCGDDTTPDARPANSAPAEPTAEACLEDQGVAYDRRRPSTAFMSGSGESATAKRHATPAAARAFRGQLYPAVKAKTTVEGRWTILYAAGPHGIIAAAVAECGLPS